jgi:hypothetical protein
MICSARAEEQALQDNGEKGGRFTLALVEALAGKATRDKDGAIHPADLFAYVSRTVRERTENKQNPYAGKLNRFDLPLTRPKKP